MNVAIYTYIITIFIKNCYFLKLADVCKIRWEDSSKLDCSNQQLDFIPDEFKNTQKIRIREIDLSNNRIKSINGSSFSGFRYLKVINLSGNKLSEDSIRHDSFAGLPKLQVLLFNENRFRAVPKYLTLSKTKNLKRLYFDDNDINLIRSSYFTHFNFLESLSLQNNNIFHIANDSFNSVKETLNDLNVRQNKLTTVPLSLRTLKRLRHLDIRDNLFERLQADQFAGMTMLEEVHIFNEDTKKRNKHNIIINQNTFRFLPNLKRLYLHYDNCVLKYFPNVEGSHNIEQISIHNIRNLRMPNDFCASVKELEAIYVYKSSMVNFPSLNNCHNLKTIEFIDNVIKYIPRDAFSGLKHVRKIEIFENNIGIQSIDHDAFTGLESLEILEIANLNLGIFLDLTGTNSLKQLNLKSCELNGIPLNFCDNMSKLEKLDLSSNYFKTLPLLSKCKNLEIIDLSKNRIKDINNQFKNLVKLKILNLNDNHISIINEDTFKNCKELTKIHLSYNLITEIHENTFQNIRNLNALEVSHNKLKVFPSKGLKSVFALKVDGNINLINFLTKEELPHANQLTLVYPYHCCFFINKIQAVAKDGKIIVSPRSSINSKYEISHHFPFEKFNFTDTSEQSISEENIEPLLRQINNGSTLFFNNPTRESMFTDSLIGESYCKPTPNVFYPCEDLFGKNWLRICIWIVFCLALLGNVSVLFILAINIRKLDIPQYLILNLAFADLCLGVYLGFLAFVDLITLGDFRSHALKWQFSSNCKVAGFLAVFASELSVYSLTIITIERFTTIKNSMHIEKKMSRKQAFIAMTAGWIFAIIIAGLPLIKAGDFQINDYTKYSVCLPFETNSLESKAYLVFILSFNILAFIIIFVCYIKIYSFIHGSNAWNSGDSKAARRMAILVFTDFICWFPICLVSLSVIFQKPFITDLWISKVLTIFIFPMNACANPFLYAIMTKRFRKNVLFAKKKFRENSLHRRENQKMFNRTPTTKSSLTLTSSVRRGSSCSFLFGRRASSRTDEIKATARALENLQQEVDEALKKEETKFIENRIEQGYASDE